jgi:hypothetical protein
MIPVVPGDLVQGRLGAPTRRARKNPVFDSNGDPFFLNHGISASQCALVIAVIRSTCRATEWVFCMNLNGGQVGWFMSDVVCVVQR